MADWTDGAMVDLSAFESAVMTADSKAVDSVETMAACSADQLAGKSDAASADSTAYLTVERLVVQTVASLVVTMAGYWAYWKAVSLVPLTADLMAVC